MKGKVVVVMGHKGGIGKTFITKHIIELLSRLDYKVLGVDYDSQGDLMKWSSRYKWHGEPMLKLNNKLDVVYVRLIRGFSVESYIRKYDYIVVDSRPDYEELVDILNMSNCVILPIEGRLSMEGAKDILEVNKFLGKKVDILLVRNKILGRFVNLNQKERRLLRSLSDGYNVPIHLVSIIDSESVRVAEMDGHNVWEFPGRIGKNVGYALMSIVNFLSLEYGNKRVFRITSKELGKK